MDKYKHFIIAIYKTNVTLNVITTLYIMIGSVNELTQIWRNSQFLKLTDLFS